MIVLKMKRPLKPLSRIGDIISDWIDQISGSQCALPSHSRSTLMSMIHGHLSVETYTDLARGLCVHNLKLEALNRPLSCHIHATCT